MSKQTTGIIVGVMTLALSIGIPGSSAASQADYDVALLAESVDRGAHTVGVSVAVSTPTGGSARIDSVDITLLYDTSLVRFAGVEPPTGSFWGDWNATFLIMPQDTIWPGLDCVRIIAGRSTSPDSLTAGPESPLLHILFRPAREDLPVGTEAAICFAWLDCRNNRLVLSGDTVLTAALVRDAYGEDVTDTLGPPSTTGPGNSCALLAPGDERTAVEAITFSGTTCRIDAALDVGEGDSDPLPRSIRLYQNYPNPFNSTTRIEFELQQRMPWRLEIVNVAGRVVDARSGVDGPGMVRLDWDGYSRSGGIVSSGAYFYRLRVGDAVQCRKMLLVK